MEKEIESLKSEFEVVRKERDHYKAECEKLQKDLQEMLDSDVYDKRIEKAETMTGSLKEFKAQPGGASTSNLQQFEVIEAKAHLTILQKKNAALQISLKAVELELKSKTMLEGQKTKLIDLQDRKLEKVQTENKRLQEKIVKITEPGNVVNGSSGENSDLTVVQVKQLKINELEEKLFISERLFRETKKANVELRKMLADLEDKGRKLMVLAKEKVQGFSEQNKGLKSDMEMLNKKLSEGDEQLKQIKVKLETVQNEKDYIVKSREDVKVKLDTLAESVLNKEETNMEMMNEVLKIREALAKAEDERMAAEYTDKLVSLNDANKKLAENLESAQTELQNVLKEKAVLDVQMQSLKAVLNPSLLSLPTTNGAQK